MAANQSDDVSEGIPPTRVVVIVPIDEDLELESTAPPDEEPGEDPEPRNEE